MTSAAAEHAMRSEAIRRLREEHYNATLTDVLPVHADLQIMRIVPDAGVPTFEPGQYSALALGNWEPRVAGTDEEQLDSVHWYRLAKRAYSISCSILDENRQLHRPREFPYLEFYVALVRHAAKHPPALTPRLFALRPGDRLFAGHHAAGHYTLSCVRPDSDVFFFATGTGEAPHNAMIAELLARGHRGRIVSALSVRYLRDAAYRACHEELARRYANFQYFLLTTRESGATGLAPMPSAGKLHLQDLVSNGELESRIHVPLDPKNAHVFLCGSPDMIGAGHPHPSAMPTPQHGSMLDLLMRRGFLCDQPEQSGNVHFERYW